MPNSLSQPFYGSVTVHFEGVAYVREESETDRLKREKRELEQRIANQRAEIKRLTESALVISGAVESAAYLRGYDCGASCRKLEVERLKKDADRIEWLEATKALLNVPMGGGPLNARPHVCIQDRRNLNHRHYYGATYREAIDTARTQEAARVWFPGETVWRWA